MTKATKQRKSKWGIWTCSKCGAEISAGHPVEEHQRSVSCTRRLEIKRLTDTGHVVIPDSWGATLVAYRVLTEVVVRGWIEDPEITGRLKMAYWIYEWLARLIKVPFKNRVKLFNSPWRGYLAPATKIPKSTLDLAADLLSLTSPTDFEILNAAARLGGEKGLRDLARSIVAEETGAEPDVPGEPQRAAPAAHEPVSPFDGLFDQSDDDDIDF